MDLERFARAFEPRLIRREADLLRTLGAFLSLDGRALLIEALARSNDQQLAGAIIFMLTASIVGINFVTDIILALTDPRVRRSILG